MDTPDGLVERLMSDIGAVAADVKRYAARPGADFTRRRQIGAGDLIGALVCMGAGPLGHELALPGAPRAFSPSAFCQRRARLDPEALRQLLLRFRPDAPLRPPAAGGLRLAAVDGTEVVMQRNPRDGDTYSPKANGRTERGYNSVHATALLDLSRGAFLDAVVQPGPGRDEPAAFRELADRCDPGLALVADRGFAGYSNLAHCIERGVGFVVRLPDAFAARLLGLPELPERADEDVELLITRSRGASLRADPRYRRVSANMGFDYLGGRGSVYRMRLRVVRFPLGDAGHESLATSLGRGGVRAGGAQGGLRRQVGRRDRVPRPQALGRAGQAALGDLPGRGPGGLRAHGALQLLLGHGGARRAGRRGRRRGAPRPRPRAQARVRRELRGRRAGLPRGAVAAGRARGGPAREDRGVRLPGEAGEDLRQAPQALVPGQPRLPLLAARGARNRPIAGARGPGARGAAPSSGRRGARRARRAADAALSGPGAAPRRGSCQGCGDSSAP